MQEFIISKKDSGQTAIKYLNRILCNAPGGLLYKQIRKKNITLNNSKMTGSEKLSEGDIIKVFMSDETILKFSSNESVDVSEYINAFNKLGDPDIVYEDDHILILNKPVGLLSQKSIPKDISANEWLIGYMLKNEIITPASLSIFTPSVCNRLDRNTGGLLIFGKTLFGSNKASEMLKNRSLSKYYRTIVLGRVDSEKHLVSFLKKDEKSNKVEISNEVKPGFSRIETYYRPLRYNKKLNITELEVDLITGKAHQIRAHLASTGHGILGDSKYGNRDLNRHFNLSNQLLYAYKIIFPNMIDYPELSEKTITLNLDSVFDAFFED